MLSEFFLYYVALLLVVAAITYLAYDLYSSGYLDGIEVTVQTPALFSHDSDVVVFYKHFVGSYRRIGKISNDIVDILPRGQARLFTIYYNAREQHNSKNSSQAAVGCIYQVDGSVLFEKHFEYQLIRWGFEKMTLPRVKEAVNFRTRSAPGIFTTLLLDHKAYPKMRQVAHNLVGGDCPLSIEVISNGGGGRVIDVFIPLDHREEFLVPEYLSSAELRSKMDDSSSCASDVASAEHFEASDEGESETDAASQE